MLYSIQDFNKSSYIDIGLSGANSTHQLIDKIKGMIYTFILIR